jgi:hypothetical protein
MYKNKTFNKILWSIVFLLSYIEVYAQSGSLGNTGILAGGNMSIINVQHTFQSGIITTDRGATKGYMSFVGTASHTGVSNTAHVDGYVRTYMTGAFTFPIGDNGKYRPASVSAAAAAAPTDAAYFQIAPTTAGYASTSMGAGVTDVSTYEYWDINGTTAATITLTWDASSTVGNIAGATIVGWNGTQWVKVASTVAGGATTSAGSISTSSAIAPNTYTVYTLGNIASATCTAGTTAPTLSVTTKSCIAPASTIDLSTVTASNTPVGTTLTWHSGTPATSANKLSSITALAPGTYYAAFYDAVNLCYSGTSGSATTMLTATCNAAGIIDCSKTMIIIAPVAGTPSANTIIATVDVTSVGCFTPITVSGSGMTLANGVTQTCATVTGIQTFHIPVNYDGTALGTLTFRVGAAGVCTADLTSTSAKKKVEVDVWTLDNCTLLIAPPTLK